MIRGITKDWHGLLDYGYVPATFAAPLLAGFEAHKNAVLTCRVLSATVLGYTLLTDAKWGAVKWIPYKTHAMLDLGGGLLAAAAPWLFGFAKNKRAKNTLLAIGLTSTVVGVLSLIGAARK